MPRLRLFSTPAIVLRRVDHGEADRLLTLLTPTRGLVRAIAKGARRITSRKAGHIELFARAHVLLAQGRNFDVLTQAELIEPHQRLREDVLRGSLAHYFCELVEQFAPEYADSSALFDLLAEGLLWLCDVADPLLTARAFEMRLLTLEGYRPELFRCVQTGEPLPETVPAAFSPQLGGVLSRKAAEHCRDARPISAAALSLLRVLQTQQPEVWQQLRPEAALHDELERITQAYWHHILERRLRSQAMVHQVAQG